MLKSRREIYFIFMLLDLYPTHLDQRSTLMIIGEEAGFEIGPCPLALLPHWFGPGEGDAPPGRKQSPALIKWAIDLFNS